ncbi:hypothetical protein [Thioclava sp. GXIMD4216]|uniref:Uncharacterized protein n=1 Tax=Thioclava litoralis TaxID=3076557 RepID=A0ABZ1E3I5_9RHOB|nr:hypothetical protein RPE78_05160 [Thioclava sp. FTW29]
MSQTPTPPPRRDGGLYFILGAIVVALGVLMWYIMGSPGDQSATPPSGAGDVSITNEVAPQSDPAPQTQDNKEPPAQVDVAPDADNGTQPQAN